jgi:membrane fusion protein (multidrug efflux system)
MAQVSLGKQVAAAGIVLAALGGGVLFHYRSTPESGAEAAVQQGAQAILVELAEARHDVLRRRIEAVGTTLARQAVDIVPLTSGRVASIEFEPGERVAAGDVLIRLDDEIERSEVAEAAAALREADLAYERAAKLRTNNTVAQATVDDLRAARDGAQARLDGAARRLADRTVRAPFAGIVGIRRIDVGARVDDDTVLTTLDDLSEVEVDFAVPEIFYGAIAPGQAVSAQSVAFGEHRFEGRVTTIDSRIDRVGRSFRVRAVLPNPDLALPAGMFMHVELILGERDAVTIPEEAVVAEGAATFVFTTEDGRARRRDVELGQRELGRVEVLDGLAAGEEVVASGLQRLRDGAEVEIRGAADGAGEAARAEGRDP